MRVLITGIAGHLGSALATWILERVPGVDVVGLDDLSCGYPQNIPTAASWHRYRLGGIHCVGRRCGQRLQEILARVDVVFHFAAYAAEGLSPWIRKYDCHNNLVGTLDLINACVELGTVKRFVFASSMSVYGRGMLGIVPFHESHQRQPIDPYGISKAACEMHLEAAHAQFGLDYTIIRPHNVYGPGQSCWQRFRNVLAHWCARALERQPLLIYGDGLQARAFSYIDDVLPCLWRAGLEPAASGQIINLGGSRPTTIADAAELLAAIAGAKVERAPARHEVRHAWCTTGKSEELLGYRDQTLLAFGLEKLWDWTKSAWFEYPERRNTHRVATLEVERGLYPFWREYV